LAAVYAEDINVLGDDIGTINKNTETLIDTSKEGGLEVNAEKTICCYLVNRMQGKIMTYRLLTDPFKCGTVQMFRYDSNKSKFDSAGN
jgi:hypothetical protein